VTADLPATLGPLLAWATSRLSATGIEAPRAEARLLLQLAIGLSRTDALLEPDRPVGRAESSSFAALVERRAAHEPMAYIGGEREFWGFPFRVGPGVLIPRPETETLIAAALETFANRSAPLRILDLGIGSGCLLLTLLRLFPNATGAGIDRSEVAVQVSALNAERLGVVDRTCLIPGSWADAPVQAFDLIVSNPPYIANDEVERLQPDVRDFEPHLALVAGPDGLGAYRELLPEARKRLHPGSALLLEIGQGQGRAVTALARASHIEITATRCDLAGIERCLIGRVKAQER
jgi:release factor glutamine methyltransferase